MSKYTRSVVLGVMSSLLVAIGCGGNGGSGGGGGGGFDTGFVLFVEERQSGEIALRHYDAESDRFTELASGLVAQLAFAFLSLVDNGDAAWVEIATASQTVKRFDQSSDATSADATVVGVVDRLDVSDDGRAGWLAIASGTTTVEQSEAGASIASTGGGIVAITDHRIAAGGQLVWRQEETGGGGPLVHFDSTDPPETDIANFADIDDLLIVALADNGDVLFGAFGEELRHYDQSRAVDPVQGLGVQTNDVDQFAIAANGFAAWSEDGVVSLFVPESGTTELNPSSTGHTISALGLSDAGALVWEEVDGTTEEVHHVASGSTSVKRLVQEIVPANDIEEVRIGGNADAVWLVSSGGTQELFHYDASEDSIGLLASVGVGVAISDVGIARVGQVAWVEVSATQTLRHYRPQNDSRRTPANEVGGIIDYVMADSGDLAWRQDVGGEDSMHYFDSSTGRTATLSGNDVVDIPDGFTIGD